MNREETVLRKVDVTERLPKEGFYHVIISTDKWPHTSTFNERGWMLRNVTHWYEEVSLSSVIEEKTEFQEQFWKNMFQSMSDCYADTRSNSDDTIPETLIEGPVVQAMTEDAFIEAMKQVHLAKQNSNLKVEVEPTLREEEIIERAIKNAKRNFNLVSFTNLEIMYDEEIKAICHAYHKIKKGE